MCPITEEQAIELARKFLENKGEIIIEYLSFRHTTKETYERRLNETIESGSIFIKFSIVTPSDAKYVVDNPQGDTRTIEIDDVTGETDYFTIL